MGIKQVGVFKLPPRAQLLHEHARRLVLFALLGEAEGRLATVVFGVNVGAILRTNARATQWSPAVAAAWRGVAPPVSLALTSAPCSLRRCTIFIAVSDS